MNRYDSRTAKWQQQNKEEQKMNKTEFIKVRCTLEEKQRIKSKGGKHKTEVLRLLP